MGLKIAEAFKDRCFLTVLATGAPATLLADVTCTVIDESGNRAALVVTEESNGWYTAPFTPDIAGTWATEWSKTLVPENYVFHYPYKEFLVGAGQEADIYTRIGAPAGANVSADVAAVKAETASLVTKVDAIDDYVDTEIAAIKADTASIITKVDAVDDYIDTEIAAIKAKTDNLPADPADDSDLDTSIAAVKAETALIVADTGELQTDWVNGGRLDLLIDAIKARTDNRVHTVTYFSPSQISVTVTNAAGDKALPTVTIPNITGTIVHAYAGFKFRMIENTNAAANKLSGAQEIQINKAGGAWTDAINFVDDQFGVALSTREGGDCVIGYTDVSGTINVFNTTAQFQWDEAVADQSNLVFNDVQTFVIISYY